MIDTAHNKDLTHIVVDDDVPVTGAKINEIDECVHRNRLMNVQASVSEKLFAQMNRNFLNWKLHAQKRSFAGW